MTEIQRYFILLITQSISTIIILGVAGILAINKVYTNHRFNFLLVFSFSIIVFLSLAQAEPLMQYFNLKLNGLNIDHTIWLLYILDLIAICYLVYNTGGLSASPFSSFLILLPTNGIILDQQFSTVLYYYIGVVPPVIYLAFWAPPAPRSPNPQHSRTYDIAVIIIFLFVFFAALAGYFIGTSAPVKP